MKREEYESAINMAKNGDLKGIKEFLPKCTKFKHLSYLLNGESFIGVVFEKAIVQVEMMLNGRSTPNLPITQHLYILFYTLEYCKNHYGEVDRSFLRDACKNKLPLAVELMNELYSHYKFTEPDMLEFEFYGFTLNEKEVVAKSLYGHLKLGLSLGQVIWLDLTQDIVDPAGARVLSDILPSPVKNPLAGLDSSDSDS